MIGALAIEGLAVERGERRLFSGLDLGLRAGEAAALVGANGAGKTSLLRAVAGLLRPAAGTIRFEGVDGPLEAEDARSAGMHLLGHHDGLKSTRTAGEELAFWAAWLGAAPGFPGKHAPLIASGDSSPPGGGAGTLSSPVQGGGGREAVGGGAPTLLEQAIDRLQLRPLLGLDVRRLSAGQRRRLALARLVASPRPLWLLDEPLAPLDASQRERFGNLMAEHLGRGGLILAAVHDPLPVPTRAVTIGAAP